METPAQNVSPATAQVSLWLGSDDLITGELRGPGVPMRPFTGWLELLAVLEEWRETETAARRMELPE